MRCSWSPTRPERRPGLPLREHADRGRGHRSVLHARLPDVVRQRPASGRGDADGGQGRRVRRREHVHLLLAQGQQEHGPEPVDADPVARRDLQGPARRDARARRQRDPAPARRRPHAVAPGVRVRRPSEPWLADRIARAGLHAARRRARDVDRDAVRPAHARKGRRAKPRLARVTQRVTAPGEVTVRLRPSAALRVLLRRERAVPASLAVTATDASGNKATRCAPSDSRSGVDLYVKFGLNGKFRPRAPTARRARGRAPTAGGRPAPSACPAATPSRPVVLEDRSAPARRTRRSAPAPAARPRTRPAIAASASAAASISARFAPCPSCGRERVRRVAEQHELPVDASAAATPGGRRPGSSASIDVQFQHRRQRRPANTDPRETRRRPPRAQPRSRSSRTDQNSDTRAGPGRQEPRHPRGAVEVLVEPSPNAPPGSGRCPRARPSGARGCALARRGSAASSSARRRRRPPGRTGRSEAPPASISTPPSRFDDPRPGQDPHPRPHRRAAQRREQRAAMHAEPEARPR